VDLRLVFHDIDGERKKYPCINITSIITNKSVIIYVGVQAFLKDCFH